MPRPGRTVSSKPAAGTSVASSPRSLPTKWIVARVVAAVDRGRAATARPGSTWPARAAAGRCRAKVPALAEVALGRAAVDALAWRATFSSSPVAAMVTSSDDPPNDTNGSGTPVIGQHARRRRRC